MARGPDRLGRGRVREPLTEGQWCWVAPPMQVATAFVACITGLTYAVGLFIVGNTTTGTCSCIFARGTERVGLPLILLSS